MVMNQKLVSVALLFLAFIFHQAAFAMPPQPIRCPSVNAIQSVGIQIVEQTQSGTWIAGVLSNNYDTTDNWTFAVGEINARNSDDARVKAVDSLNTLSFQSGPISVDEYNVWGCLYSTNA